MGECRVDGAGHEGSLVGQGGAPYLVELSLAASEPSDLLTKKFFNNSPGKNLIQHK